jgi:hypothetical protein
LHKAATDQNGKSLVDSLFLNFGQQATFTDTGLAANQDAATIPVPGCCQGFFQRG